MLTNAHQRKIINVNQPSENKPYKEPRLSMRESHEELDSMQIHEINVMLAYEFIESRLDAAPTEANVLKLAYLIEEMERSV
jgi:hypothetical protein